MEAQAYQNRPDPMAAITVSGSGNGYLVDAKSEESDNFLVYLKQQLEWSTKKQLTGTRPSFLIVRLADLSDDQIQEIFKFDTLEHSALKVIANQLFWKRPHLHSVCFRGLGGANVRSFKTEEHLTTVASVTGDVYTFKNDSCKFSNTSHISIFKSATR